MRGKCEDVGIADSRSARALRKRRRDDGAASRCRKAIPQEVAAAGTGFGKDLPDAGTVKKTFRCFQQPPKSGEVVTHVQL